MKSFECRMCGKCCYGIGGISLDDDEVERLARYMEVTPKTFRIRFCEYRNGRPSIRSGADGYCIFFDQETGCLIHPVKPRACSLWPFYSALVRDPDNWEMAKEACPGISRDCSFEDFVRESRSVRAEHGLDTPL